MWQVVDRCLEILKERSPYRPWSSRASESQSPSSSNYFGQRDEGDSGATETICRKDGSGSSSSELSVHPSVEECPEDDVIKIQVSHKEEEEEDEDEDRVQICSGSVDKSVKIILEETEDSNLASTSYKSLSLPFEGGEQECFSTRDTKIFYIKQERFEQDEGLSTPIHDPHFMKSLTQGRSLGVAEVQALYQAEYQQGGEVSYIIPAPADGFTGKIQPLPDEGVFPQVISKPVDLHGNEIVSHSVHGQVVHAPVKIMAAPDGKKFGCLCGKRFAVKPKRDRHIMLTFSLRPFGCSVCNKKFKLKHHLTEHMKTHDGTLYSCDDCGRKFRVQNCFLKHKELCKGQGWATACWTYK
uniref:Zinc finger and BTB domain-containing protein 9 n=1 Tax=Geotrypetes seraphini TaxID=260995 RepID=A0A6P8P6M4_GEOSA|nr:zinc finger and BTB domain-containing protein 9 [Geotrypetes seraphini]